MFIPDSSSVARPDIFGYLNYRAFLADFVLYLRAHRLYSARSFALKAGFKSPSYLKMIIDGERNLGPESLRRLGIVLDLRKEENEFFQKLVLFNQTDDFNLKNDAYEDLMGFKKFRKLRELENAQYEFYSKWFMPILFEAVGHTELPRKADLVAKALGISLRDLDQGLETLAQMDLIERRGKSWAKKNSAIQTNPDTESLNVRNFHRQMIHLAMDRLDGIPPDQRDLQGLTLALGEKDFKELRKLVYDFLRRLNQKYTESENATKVYQLSLQLFPVFDFPKTDAD